MLNWEDGVREQVLLREAIIGANGSGKTLGALKQAAAIGGTVGVIDTERGRALLYADRYDFKHANLTDHRPEAFRDAVREAGEMFDIVVLDSFSHEWLAVLTEADKFGDWKTLTPRHKECVEAMCAIPAHLIVTMRAKVKYGVEEVDVPGRDKPRQVITRLGVGPVQREGVEYEFDILAMLDTDHVATFANRCDPLVGRSMTIDESIPIVVKWLEEGDPPAPPPPFDPEKDVLPNAARGESAARDIFDALQHSAGHVDWGSTLDLLAKDVFGKPPKELKGSPRVEWMRRLSNATAKLVELAPGDVPPATDEQILEAFSFAFHGTVVVIVSPPEPDVTPEEADAVAAEIDEPATASVVEAPDPATLAEEAAATEFGEADK